MNTKNKKQKKPARSKIWLIIDIAIIVLVVIGVVLFATGHKDNSDDNATSDLIQLGNAQSVNINLGYGMQIVDVDSYTGIYMEDGKDDTVSDILMIEVKNVGTNDIQYAEIDMPVGEQTAHFTLSTLPIGESVIVLEANRMPYDKGAKYTTASAENVVLFDKALSLCQDKLEIQTLDNALNVTNISNEDIAGKVIIYYKNSASDMLYGGITYRVTIADGIKAGETKQVTAGHYTISGSRIMFVTCE